MDGTVVFCDGPVAPCLTGHNLGTALIQPPGPLVAGKAYLTIRPTLGSHSYTALYLGAAVNDISSYPRYPASSSKPYSLQVPGPQIFPTTTSLASSGSAGNYTLTAKVLGAGDNLLKLSGNVQFNDLSNNHPVASTALGANSFAFDFAPPQTASLSPYPINFTQLATVFDVDRDGFSDLLYVVPDTQFADQWDVMALLNDQHGALSQPVTVAIIPYPTAPLTQTPTFMVTGDFNNDDKLDLAIATDNGTIFVFFATGLTGLPFFYPLAPGPLTLPALFFADQLAVSDTSNTGHQDLLLNTPLGVCMSVNLGSPCNSGGLIPSFYARASAIAAGDFTGDHVPEIIAADPDLNELHIYYTPGTSTYGPYIEIPPLPTGMGPSAVVVADFNGDGFQDIAVANSIDNNVQVFLGDGTALNWTPASTNKTGASPLFMVLADFNDDGIWDLATANYDGNSLTVLLGKGDGTFTKKTLPFNTPIALATGDFNGDGHTDLFAAANDTSSIFLSLVTATASAKVTGVGVPGLGTHQINAYYPGNTVFQPSMSNTISLSAKPLVTTLTLTAQPSSPNLGQQVALTATLSPYNANGWTTDGGSVKFYDGATLLGTGTLSLGKATINTSSLSVGTHSLKAVYGGDMNSAFAGSTSAILSLTVGKAATTTTLTVATKTPKVGVADLLTATVAKTLTTVTGTPSGNVVFSQDGTTICSPLLVSGKATCSFYASSTAAVHITATYLGDTKFATSTSSAVTLNPTFTSNPKVVMTFDTTTLTYPGATNTRTCVTRSTSATPTGTITILDGSAAIHTQSLGGDGCIYWWISPGLNAGTHNIRAHYTGDRNNPAGDSAITTLTVNKVQTYMSDACWNSSFAYGGNYTCNVSVWSNAGSPPGSVNWKLDNGAANSATLSNGNTSFTVVKPAKGSHTVTITYPGSANYTTASAPSQSFTVQ